MAGAAQLYTADILSLAVELADHPLSGAWDRTAQVRAPVCGSSVTLGFSTREAGVVEQLGMQVQACAIGQAAAAIFARHSAGKSLSDLRAAHHAIARWLADGGALPDWPDFAYLTPAQTYPARHGAIILPWKAALEALSPAREAS